MTHVNMKHLKKFTESTESTVGDNLYLFFEIETDRKDETDDWSYYDYSPRDFNMVNWRQSL